MKGTELSPGTSGIQEGWKIFSNRKNKHKPHKEDKKKEVDFSTSIFNFAIKKEMIDVIRDFIPEGTTVIDKGEFIELTTSSSQLFKISVKAKVQAKDLIVNNDRENLYQEFLKLSEKKKKKPVNTEKKVIRTKRSGAWSTTPTIELFQSKYNRTNLGLSYFIGIMGNNVEYIVKERYSEEEEDFLLPVYVFKLIQSAFRIINGAKVDLISTSSSPLNPLSPSSSSSQSSSVSYEVPTKFIHILKPIRFANLNKKEGKTFSQQYISKFCIPAQYRKNKLISDVLGHVGWKVYTHFCQPTVRIPTLHRYKMAAREYGRFNNNPHPFIADFCDIIEEFELRVLCPHVWAMNHYSKVKLVEHFDHLLLGAKDSRSRMQIYKDFVGSIKVSELLEKIYWDRRTLQKQKKTIDRDTLLRKYSEVLREVGVVRKEFDTHYEKVRTVVEDLSSPTIFDDLAVIQEEDKLTSYLLSNTYYLDEKNSYATKQLDFGIVKTTSKLKEKKFVELNEKDFEILLRDCPWEEHDQVIVDKFAMGKDYKVFHEKYIRVMQKLSELRKKKSKLFEIPIFLNKISKTPEIRRWVLSNYFLAKQALKFPVVGSLGEFEKEFFEVVTSQINEDYSLFDTREIVVLELEA